MLKQSWDDQEPSDLPLDPPEDAGSLGWTLLQWDFCGPSAA